MRLTHEDIAKRLASLLDVALEEIRRMPEAGERGDRVSTLLHVTRDGLKRLAEDLPPLREIPGYAQAAAARPGLDPSALGANIVLFPTARRQATA
ncbi:hypothetical protein [Alsobacter sp. SYSU BS001988]|jgi:hypothetical protein